jgi:tRNA-2-methylthio-N6-dimethylallyladenosine synthase
MKRGYTVDDYRALIGKIRERVPNVSIATDVIVGFPGETDAQFMNTYNLLAELQLDVAHIAMYSPRPNTASVARWEDDVPPDEKERRRKALEDLQAEVVGEVNARFLGQTVEVLVEEQNRALSRANGKARWKGRTRNNKLVFFDDPRGRAWKGQTARVRITWTGPWSMVGKVED